MKNIFAINNKMTKLKGYLEYLCAIPTSIYFNFHYLPFKQAIRFPILVKKSHVYEAKGKIIIEAPIKFGMIKLGFFGGHMYPNNGIHWTQYGGTIIFKGSCMISNNSYIVQGKESTIIFGDDFLATASLKVISFKHIEFGKHTRAGWEAMFMDTNFHPIYDMKKEKFKKAYGPIIIGDYNWFGAQCKVMHSVTTPERCIFGMGSVLNRGGEYESYCLHGGSPIKVLSRDVMRVYGQDFIESYAD